MDHMWWAKVNTLPGRGYPKDWEAMGGGYDAGGQLVLGKRPGADDYGGIGELPYQDVFFARGFWRQHAVSRALHF